MASKVIGKLVKPPISLFGIEGRYVNALYSAAVKNNKLDAVEGDLKKLTNLYKTDPKFKEYMVSPLVSPPLKNQVLETDLKKKLNLSDVTVNLLSAMSDNRRLKKLPEIEQAFNLVMSAVRNELNLVVTSAAPLAEAKKKEVEASLKTFSSKKLLIKYAVDPAIIGGLIIDFNGEHYIDMSVRSKIRLYSNSLQQL